MIPIIIFKGMGNIIISAVKMMGNLNDVQVFNCKKILKEA